MTVLQSQRRLPESFAGFKRERCRRRELRPLAHPPLVPPRTTCAVLIRKLINFLIASDVRPFARRFQNFPMRINVMIIADVSK